MKRWLTFHSVFATVGLLTALSQLAPAQSVSGQSELYYDAGRNLVIATASSVADYDTQYYYQVYVNSTVFKAGQYVASQFPDAGQSVYLEIAANPGEEVTQDSTHLLTAVYETYEIEGGCESCEGWYDAYGYDLVMGFGDASSQGPTYTYLYYDPPLVVTHLQSQLIDPAGSGAKFRLPGTPIDYDIAFRAFIAPPYVHGPEPYCENTPGWGGVLYNGNGRPTTASLTHTKCTMTLSSSRVQVLRCCP